MSVRVRFNVAEGQGEGKALKEKHENIKSKFGKGQESSPQQRKASLDALNSKVVKKAGESAPMQAAGVQDSDSAKKPELAPTRPDTLNSSKNAAVAERPGRRVLGASIIPTTVGAVPQSSTESGQETAEAAAAEAVQHKSPNLHQAAGAAAADAPSSSDVALASTQAAAADSCDLQSDKASSSEGTENSTADDLVISTSTADTDERAMPPVDVATTVSTTADQQHESAATDSHVNTDESWVFVEPNETSGFESSRPRPTVSDGADEPPAVADAGAHNDDTSDPSSLRVVPNALQDVERLAQDAVESAVTAALQLISQCRAATTAATAVPNDNTQQQQQQQTAG